MGTEVLCSTLAAGVSVATASCTDWAAATAETRAANDFRCRQETVKAYPIGGASYRLRGCHGENVIYDCLKSWKDYACVPERDRGEGE